MKGEILFVSSDRIRIRLDCGRMSFREADILEYVLEEIPGVRRAYAFDMTGDVAVTFEHARPEHAGGERRLEDQAGSTETMGSSASSEAPDTAEAGTRETALRKRAEELYEARNNPRPYASYAYRSTHPLPGDHARSMAEIEADGKAREALISRICRTLAEYDGPTEELLNTVPENPSRAVNREYTGRLIDLIAMKLVRDFILPAPISTAWTIIQTGRYIIRGIESLKSKKLKVEVLDAISVTVSTVRGDFKTAGTIMFLLGIGDLMEEWSKKKAISDLAQRMSLNIDRVWLVTGGTEVQVPASGIREGDIIHVHTGSVIPFDGKVTEGDVLVNQASMTGESMPVHKTPGDPVYAGTVLAEGECSLKVTAASGSGRYDKVVKMIEDSQKMKSSSEDKATHLADRLVPYSLGGTALTWLLTGDVNRAVSVLMVDYSCALKLAIPLTVLSAMRECGDRRIVVKGGKYLENIAKADTIVFDKTGTLTHAVPSVADIVPFGSYSETEVLRISACLEEHYPHSMANAVVREAAERGIVHKEMHSEVEYVVAHGIASRIDGKRAVIGSWHFVFEDEKVQVPDGEAERLDHISDEYSHLYLAIDGKLAGVICISDPLREETPEAFAALRALGIRNIVMMTGDNERTAAAVAKKAGVDHYYSEVLPADKSRFVAEERKKGHVVIMVGDGINDSPALSEADAGIAISDGAAIARQIADVTVRADSLWELVYLRKLAMAMQKRVGFNYRFVAGFNTALILLGAFGVMPPATTALLHNVSTIAIAIRSTGNLVPE